MGVYNGYIDSAEEFKIKLDANEIFMNVDDNVIMKIKSSLTGIDLYRYPSNEMGDIKKLYGKVEDLQSYSQLLNKEVGEFKI